MINYLQQWEGGPGPDLAPRNISTTAPSPSSSQPSPASGRAAAASTLRICTRNNTSSAALAILAGRRELAAAKLGDAKGLSCFRSSLRSSSSFLCVSSRWSCSCLYRWEAVGGLAFFGLLLPHWDFLCFVKNSNVTKARKSCDETRSCSWHFG